MADRRHLGIMLKHRRNSKSPFLMVKRFLCRMPMFARRCVKLIGIKARRLRHGILRRRDGGVQIMLLRCLTLLLCLVVTPVLAEDWRAVSLGGLDFQVPRNWSFFHDRDTQAGGFAPDPRAFAARQGPAVVVTPGPLAPILPGATRQPGLVQGLESLAAADVLTPAPLWPGMTTRILDLDLPYATPALMFSAPDGQWAAYSGLFGQLMGTVSAHPGPMPPVPDLSGTWYRNGDPQQGLQLRQQPLGIGFEVSAPDGTVPMMRWDAHTVQILSAAEQAVGTIDAAGQEVHWSNGGVWLRQPGAAPPAAAEGEPMSLAGVTVPLELGSLRAWVPANWPQAQKVDNLGRPFVIATAPEGDALAHLVVIPGTADETVWRNLADAVTAGVSRTDLTAEAPWTWARDAEGPITLPSGERHARAQLRATPVRDGMAVLLVIWALDGNRLTMDEAAQIALETTVGEPPLAPGALPDVASPPLAGMPAQAAPAAPVRKPAAAPNGDLLFSGEMSDSWQMIGTHAQVANGLRVAMPAGSGWAKEGLWSTRPLVRFGPKDRVLTLQLALDPAQTSDFVFSLDPTAVADDWSAHDLRLHWTTRPEGGSRATLFVRQRQVAQADVVGPVPAMLELRLDRAGLASVPLPGGATLEGRLPGLPEQGWFIHAISHAAEADKPAALALHSIALRQAGAPALALAPYGKAPAGEMQLVTGTLGLIWAPLVIHGGDFARDATLSPDGLVVSVPPALGDAQTGLYTPQPVLWLEEFRDDAEASLSFTLDSAHTAGFVLALASPGAGDYPGYPPTPCLVFSFQPGEAEGRAELRITPDYPDLAWSATGPRAAPRHVSFRLTPGQVTVAAEGFDPVTLPWSQAVDGAGLHLYVYASGAPDQPKSMALTSITLAHRPASTPAQANAAAEGVAPLQMDTLFSGAPSPAWEPVGYAGGSFADFAHYTPRGLAIEIPAGHSWGVTGLLSRDPVLVLDPRHRLTPARFEVDLDPVFGPAFVMALSGTRTPDMWLDHFAWVALMPQPGRDSWALTLHNSVYSQWTREISAQVMLDWNGKLIVETAPGWLSVQLDGGPKVRADLNMPEGVPIYAALLAHAPAEGLAARLGLRALHAGMTTPPGMTAADRWALVPDDAFNPDGFLSDLATDLEAQP